MTSVRRWLLLTIFSIITACGGGGGDDGGDGTDTDNTPVYSISGTVRGLAGSGFVVQNNDSDTLNVTTNGSFRFSARLPEGSTYAVTVLTQPTNPSQSCTVNNGNGTLTGSNITNIDIVCFTHDTLGEVRPLYENNGSRWNDYILNDGADLFTASDTICDPADISCLHAGELVNASLYGRSECTGLTATDNLNAFNWVCDASTNPVRFLSTGLKADKNLSDLLDFNTPGWLPNQLNVYENTDELLASTGPATWWPNPVIINNDGSDGTDISEGEIHLITVNANATYRIENNKVALIIQPGIILNGSSQTDENIIQSLRRKFLWLEGEVDASGDQIGYHVGESNFSVLRNIRADNGEYGVYLAAGSNNRLHNIISTGNNTGVILVCSSNNILSGITLSENSYGIRLSYSNENSCRSNNNVFSEIAFINNDNGLHVHNYSSNNVFLNITASNNSNGIYLVEQSNNNLLSNVTVSDNDVGLTLTDSSQQKLSNITASNNINYGIKLNSTSNNIFSELLQVGNNGISDCSLSGTHTAPGLNDDCTEEGGSDFDLQTGITVASSFVGGDDYALLATDTVLREALSLPDGDDTLTHTWSDASTTTFLRNAVEISDDGIGNNNLLCESNETCLYTPNIAAYQGHGELIPAGNFVDGVLSNITLLRYANNGY